MAVFFQLFSLYFIYALSSEARDHHKNNGHVHLHSLHNKIYRNGLDRKAVDAVAAAYGHHTQYANSKHQYSHSHNQDFIDYDATFAEEWREALKEINLIRTSLGWHHLEWSATLANQVPESAFDEKHHSFPPTVISRPSDYGTMNLVQGVRQLTFDMLYEGHIYCAPTDGVCKAKAESADQEWPWQFVDVHANSIGCRGRLYIIKKSVLHLEVVCKTDVHTNVQSELFDLYKNVKNQHLLSILEKTITSPKQTSYKSTSSSFSSSSSQKDDTNDKWDQFEEDEIMNLSLKGEDEHHHNHQPKHHYQKLTHHQHQPHAILTSHNHLPTHHQLHKHHQQEHKLISSSSSSSSSVENNKIQSEDIHKQHELVNQSKVKKNAYYSSLSGMSSSSSGSSSASKSGENVKKNKRHKKKIKHKPYYHKSY